MSDDNSMVSYDKISSPLEYQNVHQTSSSEKEEQEKIIENANSVITCKCSVQEQSRMDNTLHSGVQEQ